MAEKYKLDSIDQRILGILQARADTPNNALAAEVGLSPAPCMRRVQRLRQMGVIRRFTIEVDPALLGYQISAFVEITLREHSTDVASRFMKAVQNLSQVISCHMVAGDCDFILRIQARDLAEYRELIWRDLHHIDGVERIHSIIVLDTFKEQPLAGM
jgi:Lrp/AsnC family leucine-responsive transcriptional regulator